MTHVRLDDALSRLAGHWITYNEAIARDCGSLSDDELVLVIEAMRGESDLWCKDVLRAAKLALEYRMRLRELASR